MPLLPGGDDADLAPLDAFESVAWHNRAAGQSTHAHPFETLRPALISQGIRSSEELRALRHGSFARGAGMVICRQRPGTAKGVVFLTLEDEAGFCNVVVWPDVYERFQVLVKLEPMLAVEGKVQIQDGVAHLVAKTIFVPQLGVVPPSGGSRDFH